LVISQSNFVVLGLGIATLIPTRGTAAITVWPGLHNVRLASVLLQASSVKSPVLLDWGVVGDTCTHCVISDLFARVGGSEGTVAQPVSVDVFVHLKSGGIVGDNLWLWRADHTHGGVGTHPDENPCKTGAIIDGDDVTMYGLAVEHTLETMSKWNGENGRSYFYQSELPYGVSERWGENDFVGYEVADHVQKHSAYGVGVYHFFRDHPAAARTGIRAPAALEESFVSPFGVYLNGKGSMQHVINDIGGATHHLASQDGAAVAFTCLGSGNVEARTENVEYVTVPASRDFTPKGVSKSQAIDEADVVSHLQATLESSTQEL